MLGNIAYLCNIFFFYVYIYHSHILCLSSYFRELRMLWLCRKSNYTKIDNSSAVWTWTDSYKSSYFLTFKLSQMLYCLYVTVSEKIKWLLINRLVTNGQISWTKMGLWSFLTATRSDCFVNWHFYRNLLLQNKDKL